MYKGAARRAAMGSGGGSGSKKKPGEKQNPSGEKDSKNKSRPPRGTSPPARASQDKPKKRSESPHHKQELPGPDYNYAVHDQDEEDEKIKTEMVEIENALNKHQHIYDRKLESYAVAYTVGHNLHRLPGLTGRHIEGLHKLSKTQLKDTAKDWAKMIENELKNDIINDMKKLRDCYKRLKNKKHIPLFTEWKNEGADCENSCVEQREKLKKLADQLGTIPDTDEDAAERVKVLREQQELFIKLATHEYKASEYRRKLRYAKGESNTYEIPVHKFFTPKKA
jgi:hypothetical protein